MYDNDTTRNFYSASVCGADNRSKGCKIPFEIIAKDFAGNSTTSTNDNTTDNSSVKFDGIKPGIDNATFLTDNCNDHAGKVFDNLTLSLFAISSTCSFLKSPSVLGAI